MPVQKDHVRARRKEQFTEGCVRQGAQQPEKLSADSLCARFLDRWGFLQTKKVLSVHPGLNHKLLCVALRVRCEDAKGP